MIPSLRYLCLEKVIAQDEEYADLPQILVKDINLMKVFNGSYTSVWIRWGLGTIPVQLKILYDGKVWNFKLRNCAYREGEAHNLIDITVKEGEVIQGETCLQDFLGIWGDEDEDMKLSGWKFKVDLQSNDDKHPLGKAFGEVKSLGAIEFNGVGQRESSVCGRFQVEVVKTPEQYGWPAEEWTLLHRRVITGSVNSSKLFKRYEAMHVS